MLCLFLVYVSIDDVQETSFVQELIRISPEIVAFPKLLTSIIVKQNGLN